MSGVNLIIGERIKEFRREKRVTQRALAEMSGISQVTISRIEDGRLPRISDELLQCIAKGVGIAPEELSKLSPIEVSVNPDERKLIVDGNILNLNQGTSVRASNRKRDGKPLVEVSAYDKDIATLLLAHHFSDISEVIGAIVSGADFSLIEGVDKIFHSLTVKRAKKSKYIIEIEFHFEMSRWKGLWSVAEYIEEFRRVLTQLNPSGVSWSPGEGPENEVFSLSFPVPNPNVVIEEEARKHSPLLKQLHELTETALMSKVRHGSVVVQFDFPKEVKVPCEQYLLYFVEFLKDVGVEATAELEHQAGQALFSITPADKGEALDKIRAALEIYLQLASSTISSSPDSEDEVSIQRLLANVDHLKSQLRLAYIMVRAQERTIQAQQVTINNQQRILSGEVLTDSLKNVTTQPKARDNEEVIDGIVSLGQYENKGLTINLAEIYRRLRKLFNKDK